MKDDDGRRLERRRYHLDLQHKVQTACPDWPRPSTPSRLWMADPHPLSVRPRFPGFDLAKITSLAGAEAPRHEKDGACEIGAPPNEAPSAILPRTTPPSPPGLFFSAPSYNTEGVPPTGSSLLLPHPPTLSAQTNPDFSVNFTRYPEPATNSTPPTPSNL